MIGKYLTQGSFARRMVTRAVVVLGAVFVGGQVMRSLPQDQTFIFPVGSVFPNATRFTASWRQPGDDEPRGGFTLSFNSAPPLQIRQHAELPNGDYIVTIDIVEAATGVDMRDKAGPSAGLQTNIERRVSLGGSETTIALAVHRQTSVSE